MKTSRNKELYDKGFINERSLEELDQELANEIAANREERKEKKHGLFLKIKLAENGLSFSK